MKLLSNLTLQSIQTLKVEPLLNSNQIHRISLDELGEPSQLPLNLGLISRNCLSRPLRLQGMSIGVNAETVC